MDQDRFDAIRLARSARIGPVTYRQLLMRYGSASEALKALMGTGRNSAGFSPAPEDRIAGEIEQVRRLGGSWLIWGNADYPALLAETDDAPPILSYRGNLALANRKCVAMVGARNASAAACRFARSLAQQLVSAGVTVVSGLARGIDTAAHQGALGQESADFSGRGATIGVIASGLDTAYPPQNASLQEKVAEEGLLLAEQPPGAVPKAQNFPHRNRIIAGLSLATVIVEAAPRSGSLITARLAGEYGREVLAVPGSPTDPRAQGCNLLIREGATLIQSAADILEAIAHIDPRAADIGKAAYQPAPDKIGEREQMSLYDLLGPVAVPVDELIRQSHLPPAAVQMELLELELAGKLERHAGGKVSLI